MPSKKILNILYISQYYPPEIGATQTRAYEMVRHLVDAGHQVTVLTEFPNHPIGIIPSEYHGKLYERKKEEGIDVLRMWVFTTQKKIFMTRILFYFSFMFMAIIGGLCVRKKFDVVYATSPPLFVGVSGYVLSIIKRAEFVLEIRDLWPEAAVLLNELSNKHFIKLSQKLEHFLYLKAKKIITVTQSFCEYISRKSGIPENEIIIIPNGANTELYIPGPKNRIIFDEWGIDQSKFVVAYTGLHGLNNGLDFVIEAANLLKEHSDIHFVFIGDGVKKVDIIKIAEQQNMKNVTFMKGQQEKMLPWYIQSCDVGLVPLKKTAYGMTMIPVKLFTYLACAKPVVFSVGGETRSLMEKADAGIYIEPENAFQLKEAILKLKSNPELCSTMGKNGRKLVAENFSRKKLAEQLESTLKKLI